MGRTVGIGIQDFGKMIEKNCFYVDKTLFIKEWWESEDDVTLIARPRRFGKTLNMSMVEQFFSVKYAGHGEWFQGLAIWKEEKYRALQGTYPVISLSFANVKEKTFQQTKQRIGQLITELYNKNDFLLESGLLKEEEQLEYADCFGFTEEEVFAGMDECGYTQKEIVKKWYDGFTFGIKSDIYNPWSILNYLDTGKITTYWANTSSNSLVGKLIREGSKNVKTAFEVLLAGESIRTPIDEQIVYNQLDASEAAIWSLLLASGYLKVKDYEKYGPEELTNPVYELELTNLEVKIMFQNMVRMWFAEVKSDYNDFVKALLLGDLDAMNEYMNRVALQTFSFFDTGRSIGNRTEPERFYHGFALGLIVELQGRYVLISNRESGFGRYDVVLEPVSAVDDAIIIEFKVHNARKEKNMEETLQNALKQIEDKKYETNLQAKGIPTERIRKYGFVFEGKTVLIG